MADNVAITAGAGTNVATDQLAGGEHVQYVKLMDGTADGSGKIGGDATNGLDVDVTRVIPGTSATNLGKAVDSAAGSTDTGVALLAVRDDALTTQTPVDGDYVPLRTDATGQLWVAATLQAGSNTIGVLGANGGVTIGDVSVTTLVPGTGAAQLGKAEDATHTTGDVGVMALAVRKATTPTDRSVGNTDGDYEPLQVDGNGRLYVNGALYSPAGDSCINDTADAVKVTLVDSAGTVVAAGSEYTEGDTDASISGVAMLWEDTSDTLRSVSVSKPLPTAPQSVIPGTAATNLGKAEDAAHQSGDTGVAVLGRRLDTPTNSAGTSGDYCTIDVAAEGGVWVANSAAIGGGCAAYLSYDLDETEEDVKTAACTLYGAWVTNTATTTRFIKFYNATAANVTVGTTTPVIVVGIPGNSSDDIAASLGLPACGVAFGTALSIAATTDLIEDGSPGAPATNDVAITVFYK